MREGTLQLELPDEADPSIWPWVIAFVGGTLLIVAARHVAVSIPASLTSQTRAVAVSAGFDDLDIDVNGRDVSLAGQLAVNSDRDAFLRRVASIDGVRSVSDTLTVEDPVADERARRAAFGNALGSLDMSGVSFQPGSASFAAGSDVALAQLAQLMKTWPEFRVRVAGHTDNTGRPAVNLRLSRERARAVADWLTSRGVDSQQVIAQGYGATQPIADNSTVDGRARNRRIEVRYVD